MQTTIHPFNQAFDKLRLINLLLNTNYSSVFAAQESIGCPDILLDIINKLSPQEIEFLVERIDEII